MKKILITGKNSYIGNSFEKWLSQWPADYQVDKVTSRDQLWKKEDFRSYDTILHVAGIAHNSSDPELKDLYYEVNTELTQAIAKKAKKEGVEQFVFMSSMIVYGSDHEIIREETKVAPDNFYGDSKLKAEEKLAKLETKEFKVAIVRPPMVYGKEAKGNYPKLAKFAKVSPIFPDYENQRSMIHIDNLCEFLRLIISKQEQGKFHPQNADYVKTSEMVREIAKVNHKKIWMTKLFNPFIRLLSSIPLIKKVFGDFVYDFSLSKKPKENYQMRTFEESIKESSKSCRR